MVGYLLFDAWLSATDRHDENWELAILEDGYQLCPTFDHGDCLGIKLSQSEIIAGIFDSPKLTESSWWRNSIVNGQLDAAEISTAEAFEIATELRPIAARAWIERLSLVHNSDVSRIFDRVPMAIMNTERSLFAMGLLEFNRQHLCPRISM
jgi:hypothetical protein